MERITLTVTKADVGGFVGHAAVHEDVAEKAREHLAKASSKGLLIDSWVSGCGDDLVLAMTHEKGLESKEIHKVGWETFAACTEVAEKLKLHNPGRDLLADSFNGTLRGLGPGLAEVSFRERPSEPVLLFMADKCRLGAWNLPLYKAFADPFTTAGLVIDPSMHEGFAFEVLDIQENRTITLQCPGDIYDLAMFLSSSGRFVVNKVIRRVDGVVAAVASGPRPIGTGRTIGTDDPVLIIRCQNGLPAVGEILDAFSFPHLVTGWLRGVYQGPLMPVSLTQTRSSRFDGPPRVTAAGFQLANGEFIGPVDLFADVAFDPVRAQAMQVTEYMRRHGPFEPHRVPHDQMANTPFHPLLAHLDNRMVRIDGEDRKGKRRRTSAAEDAE